MFQSQYPHLKSFASRQYKGEEQDNVPPPVSSVINEDLSGIGGPMRIMGQNNMMGTGMNQFGMNNMSNMMGMNIPGMMGANNIMGTGMGMNMGIVGGGGGMNDMMANQMYGGSQNSFIGSMNVQDVGGYNMYNGGNLGYPNHDFQLMQFENMNGRGIPSSHMMNRGGRLEAFGVSDFSGRGGGQSNMNNNNDMMQALMYQQMNTMNQQQSQQTAMWRPGQGMRQGPMEDPDADYAGQGAHYERSSKRRRNHYGR